jgi:hypothetical protein
MLGPAPTDHPQYRRLPIGRPFDLQSHAPGA